MDEQPNPEELRSQRLMELGEGMTALTEWAEGQRLALCQRGWSLGAAESIAGEMLKGLIRVHFSSMTSR